MEEKNYYLVKIIFYILILKVD